MNRLQTAMKDVKFSSLLEINDEYNFKISHNISCNKQKLSEANFVLLVKIKSPGYVQGLVKCAVMAVGAAETSV